MKMQKQIFVMLGGGSVGRKFRYTNDESKLTCNMLSSAMQIVWCQVQVVSLIEV